jgi:GR25 family glycosyltransferase involved in LPS biosynthesis
MRSVVLHAPHLGRDLRALHEAVPDLLIYEGERTPKGEDGCLEGHKTIVREAMELGERRVFVMEDDCEFTPHFDWERWQTDATWAEFHGYDVMVGGCTRTYGEKAVRYGMIEVSAFHSAHCVVYFASGYEKALKAVQPYDLSLGTICGMRCVLTHPFVAVQRPSFSGILQQDVDYVPLYERHEARLGHLPVLEAY